MNVYWAHLQLVLTSEDEDVDIPISIYSTDNNTYREIWCKCMQKDCFLRFFFFLNHPPVFHKHYQKDWIQLPTEDVNSHTPSHIDNTHLYAVTGDVLTKCVCLSRDLYQSEDIKQNWLLHVRWLCCVLKLRFYAPLFCPLGIKGFIVQENREVMVSFVPWEHSDMAKGQRSPSPPPLRLYRRITALISPSFLPHILTPFMKTAETDWSEKRKRQKVILRKEER